MNILHISDIHYRIVYEKPESRYEKMLCRMENPGRFLEFCLRQAMEKYSVDLLVITGDLTDEGTAEDYASLKKIVEKTVGRLPVLVTPGNHDIRANMRTGWLGQEAISDCYCHSYESGGTVVLSFDSSEHGNPDGTIGEEQIKWLAAQLKEHREKQAVLITHHHFHPGQADIAPVKAGEDFLKLLRDYRPVCILNGHTHHPAQGMIGDVPYYTAGSMSFCGDTLEDGRIEFRQKYGYSWYCIENGSVKRAVTETFNRGPLLDTFRWE